MKKIFITLTMFCMGAHLQAQGFNLDLEGDLVSPKYEAVNQVVQGLKAAAGVGFFARSLALVGKIVLPGKDGYAPNLRSFHAKALDGVGTLGSISLCAGLGIVFTFSSYEYFKKHYEIRKKK